MAQSRVSRVVVSRPVRWSAWLALGVLVGLAAGFLAGLAKPRIRRRGAEDDRVDNAFPSTREDEVLGQWPDPQRAERAIKHRLRK